MAVHFGPYSTDRAVAETRWVGLGSTAANTSYLSTGMKQHNTNVQKYAKFADHLKSFMCAFHLTSLANDALLVRNNDASTVQHTVKIKSNGSIELTLVPQGSGAITWTTDAGTAVTGKNYMIVVQCSAFNSSILSNTSMYLGAGGTITNLTSGMSDGDGIANPGGGGYTNASGQYVSSYDSASAFGAYNFAGPIGIMAGIHYWTGGILTLAAITALYNSGTPLTDPGTASGDYTSTFSGYYYDGGDFTGLSAQTIATSTELNDISNFNYLAGSGGPECTMTTNGSLSIIHP